MGKKTIQQKNFRKEFVYEKKNNTLYFFPDSSQPVIWHLYLTYNKLLKVDAKSKITTKNVTVTNYHGFASKCLQKANIPSSVSELILTFLKNSDKIKLPIYDVLIIDEYQDIDSEISDMLECIKSSNPEMQIVAVGDMKQKIYDKTTRDKLSRTF